MRSNIFNLHEPEYRRIQAILEGMRKELRAELALLISRSGQPIVISGAGDAIDITALSSLAAANLAATDGLANIVGEREFSVLAHQGKKRSLFISDLLKRFSLVLVFDASASSGLVRYKCKHTSLLLEEVLKDFQRKIEKEEPSENVTQFSDAELEELLGE
ncbi:MAG TPA: roadblock/LC7 domain-containing protein [Acidobacteriota bacterium]|nr:roadblock/LC7 domain-containing protein [Acidobacteriota bacterium]